MENVGLALPHIHYNMETDLDEIIRRFARLHLRRMELANIQNPRKGDFRAGVTENPQKFPGEQEFPQYYFPRQF